MDSRRIIENILIIASFDKGVEFLLELLQQFGIPEVSIARSGSEARRKVLACNYDIILIYSPLSDELGHEIAQDFAETTAAGIIIIVKNDIYEEISYRVMEYGVMALPRPLHREVFYQAINTALATRERLRVLEKENDRLKSKLDETRLIDRAKFYLMESEQMTEQQAHKYIEQQAMNSRINKIRTCEKLLKATKRYGHLE